MNIDKSEIVRLTEEYGGGWGIHHTQRLLRLISIIGEGLDYNAEALWLAAHLHDWGAYPHWAQEGIDHALRSRQVAEQFLAEHNCPEEIRDLILECIEHHHAAGSDRSLESILLRDADALDFLGVVGVFRNFSINPRDMRKAFQETKRRRDRTLGILGLEKSRKIAADRVTRMNELLTGIRDQIFGLF